MKIKERLDALVAEGAVLAIGNISLTLARAVIMPGKPTRLRWCAIFPEHQGHVREIKYERAVPEAGGRDIGFYVGDEMVAYVAPYLESTLPTDEVRDALAAWRALLAGDGNKNFIDFFEGAL